MNLGGDVSVTVPSGSTGQVCEPEEGQYEIQNSPDSLEPIVAEVNGVTYVYEPGDIGVPVEVDTAGVAVRWTSLFCRQRFSTRCRSISRRSL
jgi:hypothetical protein